MVYILLRNDRASAREVMVILSILSSSPGLEARIIVHATLHPLRKSLQYFISSVLGYTRAATKNYFLISAENGK